MADTGAIPALKCMSAAIWSAVMVLAVACGSSDDSGTKGTGASTSLTAPATPAVSVIGSWHLEAITPGEVYEGSSSLKVNFGSDGTLLAADLCNTITGEWSVPTSTQIEFQNISVTTKVCPGKADVLSIPWLSATIGLVSELMITSPTATMTWRRD